MSGRRVLITGLATFWGGLVAKHLEGDPSVDVLIGLDTREPSVELERTEYVRTDENYSILARIVRAARIDTIVHTFLVVDSTQMSRRTMHEINVIGTMNLFAAASTPGSTVRDVVVKSSGWVYGTAIEDPVWFTEETPRSHPPRTAIEQSLEAVEGYVRDFAEDNPHVNVTLLRFSNVLGPDIETPITRALELPVVPSVFGFDPRIQFVHEDDVIRSILFVLERRLPGIYNVAGDGLIPWSEVAAICGKRTCPLPPVGTELATWPLRRIGVPLPEELLDLLRYGRGMDNRRLKRAGFEYLYTSAGAVEAFVEALRLRQTVGGTEPAYRYERDVEQFFRHSPAIVRDTGVG
ncbi:NAD-dependent epimerase/dehydratase family protein [Rhabdothermincola sediminis]|uniref:NAD-dependent epimerase/dehydratase family protein n=1 Tax=Rhabdothermincola sediminis TaxID=2751370 RepID=UPI001AA05525|nr:NAD-dependent epimerase/dehydratase family protein [Rhabdothermincola sediminis]